MGHENSSNNFPGTWEEKCDYTWKTFEEENNFNNKSRQKVPVPGHFDFKVHSTIFASTIALCCLSQTNIHIMNPLYAANVYLATSSFCQKCRPTSNSLPHRSENRVREREKIESIISKEEGGVGVFKEGGGGV